MYRNCFLSAYRLKGSNGIFWRSQKETIIKIPSNKLSHTNVLSRSNSSRSFFQTETSTPEAPKPMSAVEIIRNPKWYQSVTEKTLVKDNSNNNDEKDKRKIPQ